MGKLKFYCGWFCPFAQRAWIALVHKNVPFEYIEFNPYKGKTKEFLQLNPRGLVPVIEVDGKSVYESNICIEFIDEYGDDDVRLLPESAIDRAKVRIISEYISREIVPLYYKMLLKQDKDVHSKIKEEMLTNLKTLMDMKSDDTAFLVGDTLGMADIMLIPFTMRFPVLQHYRGFEVPNTDEYRKVHDWMKVCHNHPSVLPTAEHIDKAIMVYQSYADGTATVRSKL